MYVERVKSLAWLRGSRVRPFDTHITLPTISNDHYFRCKLNKIGFDIILCNSDTCPPPSRGGSDAKSNNILTSLITGEKSNFQIQKRGRATARHVHVTTQFEQRSPSTTWHDAMCALIDVSWLLASIPAAYSTLTAYTLLLD
eukprot:scaffold3120_cov219-Skeletonema_marinoi.AAC.4